MTLCVVSIAAAPGTLGAQGAPFFGPPFSEAQAVWNAFWGRLLEGDVDGARRHVHTLRKHRFPWNQTVAELQDIAQQMSFCRLQPEPLPLDLDEVLYQVRCEHEGEKAEMLVGLRRDVDGVWRISRL